MQLHAFITMQQKNRDVKQAGKFGSNVKQAGNNNFIWLQSTLFISKKEKLFLLCIEN